jgi:GNAT superfamily N-acetyltransferase
VDGVRVVEAGPERVPDIEPLWRALYEHHRGISSGVADVRPFAETWRRRRRQYEEWLAGENASMLIAEREGRPVGYAAVTVGPGPATWDLGDPVVELETLSVLPEERGSGVGRALMQEVRRWAHERGATAIAVGLAHTNDVARRFYERQGFNPFYIEMVLDLRSR